MTLAGQIAERIHALRFEAVTPTALAWTGMAFIDTVGVALAGIVEEAPRILLRLPGVAGPGPCLIFGTSQRTGPLDATLLNGTASHALDFDDVSGVMGGHPSAMLVAPLLALGEMLGSNGRDLALAYVVGYEAECRIARGVHFHHYDKGWHPTATLGIFGTVAAAARLLHLSVAQTAVALGLAASLASGLKASFGTMTKPLHVGHGARNGLFAALLAREGFTANPGAFEHKQGFLDVFNGPGTYDTTRMLADWYAPFECDGGGEPSLKPYPCCGSTHASINRMIDLARTHDLTPAQVAKIEILPHGRRLPHTDNPDPRTPLGAKFSIQYCVARALADRAVKLEHFEADAPFDPTVRALMARTEARAHPDMADDSPLQWGAEIAVTTRDGRRFASRLDDFERLGPGARPMTREELWEKFSDCAQRALPRPQIAPLFEQLARIVEVENVAELTRLMEVLAATRPAQAA
ncbi:MAG TPA: MmgE/PrpD family protein [Acetobacteraceae bacterium]|nr:MmgE/PrpD family protein [Acetobacteraceae bacterium]